MFTINSLGPDSDQWIREQVSCGNFASESDVFFEAIRLFKEISEDRHVGDAVLKAQIEAGINSGPGRPAHEVFADLLNKHKSRAAA